MFSWRKVLVFFQTVIMTATSVHGTSDDWGEFTYEPGEWETMIVDLIKNEVPSLHIKEFADDPQLLQRVDRVNKFTTYHQLNSQFSKNEEEDEETQIVYQRKAMDGEEPIVVLRSSEDHLKTFLRKRTFVILRQNPETSNTYFVSYVYLRFWTDKQQNCKETYLNEKLCIEWDTWDNDRGEIKLGHKFYGWNDCASSFLFSCTAAQGNASKNPTGEILVERGYRNQTFNYHQPNETKLVYKPTSNIPMDDTIDAFFDLEISPGEARYVRETIRQTSVFRKPAAFVGSAMEKTKGRSLHKADTSKSLATLQKNVHEAGIEHKAGKDVLHSKLDNRIAWHRKKNDLFKLLKSYCNQMGFRSFEELKKHEDKLNQLKTYKNASQIIVTLQEMGDTFTQSTSFSNSGPTKSVKFLEVHQSYGDSQAAKTVEESPSTKAFGKALGEIMKNSGGTMSGRALGDTDNKLVQTIANSILLSKTDLFQVPGWKWQNTSTFHPNRTNPVDAFLFYGLGSCPPLVMGEPEYKNLTSSKNSTDEDTVDYFLKLFRTHCSPDAKEYMKYLLQERIMQVNSTKFVVPAGMPLLQKRKLRTDDLRILSAALELSAFSHSYGEMFSQNNVEPTNTSRSVDILQNFGIQFITQGRILSDEHFIKLCRNLVITFKAVLTKLIQDEEILKLHCKEKECTHHFNQNFQDRFAIHSLIQFLTRGLSPIEMSANADVALIFKEFVTLNEVPLRVTLSYYN